MPQRFLILLTQVQAGNASENLLSEIQQIVRSLYQAKKKYTTIYSNKYRNEYDVHEFKKQQDLLSA